MIRILGDDGNEIAAALLNQVHDPVVLVVDRVTSGKGKLLQYYFGQGRRHVVADLGDFRLRGSLRTRWQDGERRWEIRLHSAGESEAIAPATAERVQHTPTVS